MEFPFKEVGCGNRCGVPGSNVTIDSLGDCDVDDVETDCSRDLGFDGD